MLINVKGNRRKIIQRDSLRTEKFEVYISSARSATYDQKLGQKKVQVQLTQWKLNKTWRKLKEK
jgi:hypothetical protein